MTLESSPGNDPGLRCCAAPVRPLRTAQIADWASPVCPRFPVLHRGERSRTALL